MSFFNEEFYKIIDIEFNISVWWFYGVGIFWGSYVFREF